MSKQTRYLLTVDSATGVAVKLERLGEAGDLTEVPLSTLSVPMAGAASAPAAPSPQSLVINIYMGGPQQAAPLSISMPAAVGPGGPAPSLSTVGPGGPAPSLAGPGGPSTPGAPPEGPGGPGSSGRPPGGGEGGSR
jgi:hypothetical protein